MLSRILTYADVCDEAYAYADVCDEAHAREGTSRIMRLFQGKPSLVGVEFGRLECLGCRVSSDTNDPLGYTVFSQ